jgi:hypothetical protein
MATITQARGCDEVWYDSGSQHYFLAAGDNPGGSVLAIVDANTLKWVQISPQRPIRIRSPPMTAHIVCWCRR